MFNVIGGFVLEMVFCVLLVCLIVELLFYVIVFYLMWVYYVVVYVVWVYLIMCVCNFLGGSVIWLWLFCCNIVYNIGWFGVEFIKLMDEIII